MLSRTHLILHVARTHGYSKVMTGDSCTRLAIKLMTSLALGRGAFLAWDTVHGCRPLRDPAGCGVVSRPRVSLVEHGRRTGSPSAGGGEERAPLPTQGFSDERHGDVVVVRPMRDHTLKEVAFYNRLFAVPSVFTPAIDTKVSCGTWAGTTCPPTPGMGSEAAGIASVA